MGKVLKLSCRHSFYRKGPFLHLISKQGKAPRRDVERVLEEKLPGWRVKLNLDKYIQQGYLGEDDQGVVYLDWRSRAEIDQKKLVDLVVAFGKAAPSNA